MLHPVRDRDAKGVGGLGIARLEKLDVSQRESQPLVPGVLGEELLQCGVVQLPLDLPGESVLKCKGC